jgi:hypothetical protein
MKYCLVGVSIGPNLLTDGRSTLVSGRTAALGSILSASAGRKGALGVGAPMGARGVRQRGTGRP